MVVEASLEAQPFNDNATFIGITGDLDGTAALELGYLIRHRVNPPLAAATTTISPGFGWPISTRPLRSLFIYA